MRSATACDTLRGVCTTFGVVGGLRAMLGHYAGGGVRLPQAKAPTPVAPLVMLFEPESHCRGSGSFVLQGGSRKTAVALLGVHTPSKNPTPVS